MSVPFLAEASTHILLNHFAALHFIASSNNTTTKTHSTSSTMTPSALTSGRGDVLRVPYVLHVARAKRLPGDHPS